MSPRESAESLRVEQVLCAHRERDAEGLPLAPPAWWDLAPEDRERAFAAQFAARAFEAALHPRGWSGSVQAVLARLT